MTQGTHALHVGAASAALSIGTASAAVQLDRPVPMSGFAARTQPSEGFADVGLRATAVAFDQQVLVFLDAIGVDPWLADAVRERAALTGVEVTVLATHTHAGPCVLHRGLGPYSPTAGAALADAGGRAARGAVAERKRSSVEWLTPTIPGVAHNRRRGERSPDAQLKALRWLHEDGVLGGVLVSYPCHPTSVGPTNRLLSADYPGYLRQAVERTWGGVCAFATGCAGDINTGHAASASFNLQTGQGGRTLADSARVGEHLAGAVLDGEWSPLPVDEMAAAAAPVVLQQRPLDADLAALQAEWRMQREGADPGVVALMDNWLDWAARPAAGQPAEWRGRVGLLRLGDVRLAMLPGEPFLDAARELDRRASALGDGTRVLALGYFEDCPGYFPSAPEYAAGGYEVVDAHRYYGMPAPFAEGSLETLVDVVWGLAR